VELKAASQSQEIVSLENILKVIVSLEVDCPGDTVIEGMVKSRNELSVQVYGIITWAGIHVLDFYFIFFSNWT
jgi:hypothetical protein